MKVVKAAAVQLSPVLYSREGTIDKVVRTIHARSAAASPRSSHPIPPCCASRFARAKAS